MIFISSTANPTIIKIIRVNFTLKDDDFNDPFVPILNEFIVSFSF
jgi:hypothetical protein